MAHPSVPSFSVVPTIASSSLHFRVSLTPLGVPSSDETGAALIIRILPCAAPNLAGTGIELNKLSQTRCFTGEEFVAAAYPVHYEGVRLAFLAPRPLKGFTLIPPAPVSLHATVVLPILLAG